MSVCLVLYVRACVTLAAFPLGELNSTLQSIKTAMGRISTCLFWKVLCLSTLRGSVSSV